MDELSNDFVAEVQKHQMTPIETLNWYCNLYYTENNDTEQGIMARAINDIFMCFKDMYGADEKSVLEMLEERYAKQVKINSNTCSISGGKSPIIPKGTTLTDFLYWALEENKNEEL